ncbi:MAG: DNA repair protein RecN, partial [Gammaproteobacteria bacterium]
MLEHLHIRHLAIIDEAKIEFERGMTALTGETGAGKSILLDALGLLLGDRARSDLVQEGKQRAEVAASFAIEDLPEITNWIDNQQLDADGECLIRRTVSAGGKSRASINGTPVTLATLRELGSMLVGIHGQHAHQRLLDAGEQRRILDARVDKALVDETAAAWASWSSLQQALDEHRSSQQAREQRIDLLSFQLQEFDELDIGTLSIEELESEHRWLANADRLRQAAAQALAALDDTAAPAIDKAIAPLGELAAIDERLREGLDLVESAGIQVRETVSLLASSLASLEHDDARLDWLDEKLGVLHRLGRKHGAEIAALPEIEETLRAELDRLEAPAASLEALQADCDAAEAQYLSAARALGAARRSAAGALGQEISRSLQSMKMKDARFEVDIDSDPSRASAHGVDRVAFRVAANAGQSPQPLARVASGGELSRISLCIELAGLERRSVPTLIFDEVDSGVGGAVAETVGRLLRQVGNTAQVLCVTHLPQVAAQAHAHLQVAKHTRGGKTRTRIKPLTGDALRD